MTVTTQNHPAIAPLGYPACAITYTRDTWVHLTAPPSLYSATEAQLLCPDAPDTWVVWIPEYGEAVLRRCDFFL